MGSDRAERWASRILLCLLSFAPIACGGGGSTPTSPSTTSPGTSSTVTTTLPAQVFTSLASNEARYLDVQVNVTGTLEATADWTFRSDDLDIYVTSPGCIGVTAEDLSAARGCAVLAKADGTLSKPEHLTMSVTPGMLRIWVASFGPQAESGTLLVTVTGK
jgi:hypothetical protein